MLFDQAYLTKETDTRRFFNKQYKKREFVNNFIYLLRHNHNNYEVEVRINSYGRLKIGCRIASS